MRFINFYRQTVKIFVSFSIMAKAKCSHSCETKCGKNRIHPDVLKKLEDGYKNFSCACSKSLLKKYLTQDIFDGLKFKKTSYGSSLLDCVQSGFENLDSGCGIYAPDPDAYKVFTNIFDPIIEDYHIGFKKSDCHPSSDWGDTKSVGNLDPTGKFVVSTRVRCGRSLEGYPFNPCLTESQYCEIEEKVETALKSICDDELKGEYRGLKCMSKDEQQKLIDGHYLFKEGDKFLQAANACRFWPKSRGIFYNDKKTFLVWVNEEDHVRIISMQEKGDLGAVYARLAKGVQELEKKIKFAKNSRIGYLTFCPTNLGTSMRASVHIKLPKLGADKTKLESLAKQYNLQVRGTTGEHTTAVDGVYDISNKRRLGLTEAEAIKEMHKGITALIEAETKAK